MEVSKINPNQNLQQSFKGNIEQKQTKKTEISKENGKKIALALTGLAAVGAAAIGIAMAARKGKGGDLIEDAAKAADNLANDVKASGIEEVVTKETQGAAEQIIADTETGVAKQLSFDEQVQEIMDGIKETVSKKDGEFVFSTTPKIKSFGGSDSAIPTLDTAAYSRFNIIADSPLQIDKENMAKKRILNYEYTKNTEGDDIVKYEGAYFVPSEHIGRTFVKEFNLKTGETKLVGTRPETMRDRYDFKKSSGMIRSTNPDGVTIKNGEEFAKRTIKTNANGDKLIEVDYPGLSWQNNGNTLVNNLKKVILVKADGTKKIGERWTDFFNNIRIIDDGKIAELLEEFQA